VQKNTTPKDRKFNRMTGEIFLAPGAGRMMSTLKLRIQKAEILIEG